MDKDEELKNAIIEHKSGTSTDLKMVLKAVNEENKSFTVRGKGSNKGTLENGKLVPNEQTLIVDQKAFDVGIIPGISRIWLVSEPGIFYDFTVYVEGACPKGKWDNKLVFKDESGDEYTLRIYSTTAKKHYVNYHSRAGNIVKITWDI